MGDEMAASSSYKTPQEEFWAGEFGSSYIGRNESDQLLASNLHFFSSSLRRAGLIASCVELGANIGMNLRALRLLYPSVALQGVEINAEAARQLGESIGPENVFNESIYDWNPSGQVDLTLAKGVLIHIQPEMLSSVYEKLYNASSNYILLAEYYNRSPVMISYRGHEDRLFKRDFAGEMLDRFSDLVLVDYGFSYHRDRAFPQDDITWFLMQKDVR
jgi:pseudaminic acid biosynthesis-associated methylase